MHLNNECKQLQPENERMKEMKSQTENGTNVTFCSRF